MEQARKKQASIFISAYKYLSQVPRNSKYCTEDVIASMFDSKATKNKHKANAMAKLKSKLFAERIIGKAAKVPPSKNKVFTTKRMNVPNLALRSPKIA